MKNEISKNNLYWIPRHRYRELKNWCMQYHEWEEEYSACVYLTSKIPRGEKSSNVSDPTSKMAVHMRELKKKMDLIENICKEVAPRYAMTLLVSIINGTMYDTCVTINPALPSRSEWYKARRKFFYILSQKRD